MILLVKKTCGVTLEDDKVIEILAKEVKQSNAMLEFEKGNRQDFIEENKS
ncbi:GatB/YqeY domain-containing protein [Clostridium sp. 1001271B_151109_B4]